MNTDLLVTDPRWSSRLRTGATLVLVGFIPQLWLPLLGPFVDPGSPASSILWIPSLLAWLGLSIGGFLVSGPLPVSEGRAARYLREPTRFFSILFFARGAFFRVIRSVQIISPAMSETIWRVDRTLLWVGFILMFGYLALLARRVGRPSVAKQFLAMLVIIPGAQYAMIGLFLTIGGFPMPFINAPSSPSSVEYVVIYSPFVLVSAWFVYLMIQFLKAIRPRPSPSTPAPPAGQG